MIATLTFAVLTACFVGNQGQILTAACKPQVNSQRWFNWDEQLDVITQRCPTPDSVEELKLEIADAKARGGTVKVFGTGHSHSDIVLGNTYNAPNHSAIPHRMLALNNFNKPITVHADKTVTLGAGYTIEVLARELLKHKLTVKNLGTSQIQNYVGAFSTGTHGTGKDLGNVASQVVGFHMLLANGTIVYANKTVNNRIFEAGRLGIGAIGLILNVTIQAVDAFKLKRTDWLMNTSELIQNIQMLGTKYQRFMAWGPVVSQVNGQATLSAFTHVSLFEEVPLDTPLDSCAPLQRCFDVVTLNLSTNVTCTDWSFSALAQSPKDVDGCDGYYQWNSEIEHFFPLACGGNPNNFQDALLAYINRSSSLAAQFPVLNYENGVSGGRQFNMGAEFQLRFVRGDDIWISPVHSTTNPKEIFGVINLSFRPLPPQDTASVQAWNAKAVDFQATGEKFCYRPHWGKLMNVTADWLNRTYPNFEQFSSVRSEVDPSCLFINSFLKQNLGIDNCKSGRLQGALDFLSLACGVYQCPLGTSSSVFFNPLRVMFGLISFAVLVLF